MLKLNRLRQFLDLKKILTAVLFLLAGYTVTVLNNAASAHEAGLHAERILEGNGGQGVVALLKEIKQEVIAIKQMQKDQQLKEFFIYNAIADIGTFGPETPFIMVNELGIAQIYNRGQTHMKVRNTSSSQREALVFKIQGSFQDDSAQHAIKISQRAGRMLGANGSEIRVEISPVPEVTR